ncbi:unnamed protein product, partial [marine sediment metagenome]
ACATDACGADDTKRYADDEATSMPDIEETQRQGWNYRHLISALVIGFMIQMFVFPSHAYCGRQSVALTFAFVFDGLIVLRIYVALWVRQKGKGWIFYAVLLYSSPFWIALGIDNGLIVLTVPVLLAIVCENIVRRQSKRHNRRMHQTPAAPMTRNVMPRAKIMLRGMTRQWPVLTFAISCVVIAGLVLFRGCESKETKEAVAYVSQGYDHYKAGQYEDAIIAYKKAIVLKPDYVWAHRLMDWAYHAMASKYCKLNQYNKAIVAYKEYI